MKTQRGIHQQIIRLLFIYKYCTHHHLIEFTLNDKASRYFKVGLKVAKQSNSFF